MPREAAFGKDPALLTTHVSLPCPCRLRGAPPGISAVALPLRPEFKGAAGLARGFELIGKVQPRQPVDKGDKRALVATAPSTASFTPQVCSSSPVSTTRSASTRNFTFRWDEAWRNISNAASAVTL